MQDTTTTPSSTPPRRPRWPRRHPILAGALAVTLGGIVLLIILAAVLGNAANQALNPNSTRPLPPVPVNSSGAQANPDATTPPPAPSGPETFVVGDSAIVTQNGQDAATVTVLKVEESTQPVDQFSYGPAKGYFVDVLVRYRAKDSYSGGFDVSPLDWYAKVGSRHFDEGDGNAYEGPHSNSELDSPTLNAGEETTGWLVFDLPSAHGKIAYAPNYDGGPLGYWRF